MSKKIIITIFVLLFIITVINVNQKNNLPVHSQEHVTNASTGLYTTNHGRLEREYYLHVPNSYTGSEKTPLVVNLHGGGGSYKSAITGTQMNKKADEEGFIIAYPNSAKAIDGSMRWNNGPRTVEPNKQSLADDIGFLGEMIQEIEKDFSIDSSRIYLTGMSSGGAMTYRAACEMSDIFAAAAPVGAPQILTSCEPEKPIPLMHIHGDSDPLVPLSGTPSAESVPKIFSLKDSFPSVIDAVGLIREANACSLETKITYDVAGSICTAYQDCENDVEVTYCVVANNGHTWPGGEYPADGPFYKSIVGEISNQFNTNEIIWDFFTKHTRD